MTAEWGRKHASDEYLGRSAPVGATIFAHKVHHVIRGTQE
jgi:hypothetical protein